MSGGAVLEARAVIVGQDKTKAAFDSIEARINKLVGRIAAIDRVMGRVDQIAGPMNRATSEVRKFEVAAESMKLIDQQAAAVRRSFTETAQSIEKATAAAAKFGKVKVDAGMAPGQGHGAPGHRGRSGHSRFETLREITGGIAPMVGLGLAFEGAEAVRGAVKGGFERQHERTRMATSGMSPREITETEGLSADLTSQYAPVGQTEIMHLMRNARSVVGSYDEAAKAINAFGDTLRPTDFYEMFKYGRQSTSGFSQDYMMTVAPTLAQEMKGSSAGVANSAFFRAIVGGRMEKGALARLEDLGLVDKSKLITPKGGHIASAAGAIKGTQLAQLNPYEWVNQILLPAMHKKGIVDPQKVQEVINSVFSNQVAAQMVGIYATQQSRIEKDRGVIAHTMDTPQAARAIMEHDPMVAAEGLKNALENLGTVFADKTLHLAGGMTSMAEAVNRFSAQLQHAYDKPNDGQPSPGQQRFNRLMNKVEADASGLLDGGSAGDREAGRRASLIATARAMAGAGEGLDYDSYEASRNAGRLKHDAAEREPQGFWDSLWVSPGAEQAPLDRQNAATLEAQARKARAAASTIREFAQMGDDLNGVDQQLSGYQSSMWRQTIGAGSPPPTIVGGAASFPMGRSYADLPMPGDEPWNPQRQVTGGATPSVEEHHEDPAEALRSALSGGTFMAQLDPGSKATIDASFEVKPSSDLLQVVEKAKSIVASGSLSAGGVGSSGGTGVSYPETAPGGRGGIGHH